MDALLQGVRQAFRALRRAPGFTAVAVLTLGLGIGGTTAIFSILDGTVLRPVPWPEPDRLVVVGWNWGGGKGRTMRLTPAKAAYWETHGDAFEAFAVTERPQFVWTDGNDPEQLAGELVSEGYFHTIGAAPALGRPFLPDESVPGGPAVVILSEVVGTAVAAERFLMRLLASFAAVALILTAVGIYGVVAYAVRRRTREVGIRMALGARSESVIGLIVWRGMRMVAIGLGIGLVAALALGRAAEGLLFGVSANDPAPFAAIVLILSAVALGASYLPARRAARMDPMATLRSE